MLPATRQLADASLRIPSFKAALDPKIVDAKTLGPQNSWLEKEAWSCMAMARALGCSDADARLISAAYIQTNYAQLEAIGKQGGVPDIMPFMRFVGQNSTFEAAPSTPKPGSF